MYLPVEMPTGDYYGGHRPGAGLFGESLVAVDVEDRQAQVALPVHQARYLGLGSAVRADPGRRDDRRAACARSSCSRPSRAGCTCSTASPASRSGRSRSGRSERPTCRARSRNPTQLFVTKPPPFERQGVGLDDLIDFTPALKAEGQKLVSRFKLGPALHAARREQVGRPARHADAAERHRRRQLAGRLVRSRDRPLLHLHQHRHLGPRARPGRRAKSDMRYVRGPGAEPGEPEGAAGAADRAGAAAREAALRPHHRARSQDRHAGVAGRPRRDARQHPEPPSAQGRDHSAHRPAGAHRHAGDEVAARSRARAACSRCPTGAAARCCAPTTRRRARTPAPSTCRRRRPGRR